MPKKLDSILIADDNRDVLMALRVLLNNYFHIVETINNPECIPMMLAQRDWSVMLLDMNFKAGINSGNEGLYWLRLVKKRAPQLPVVLFTAYADVELAVKGMKEGAADFVVKPYDNHRLVETLLAAATLHHQQKKNDKTSLRSILPMYWGESRPMQELRHLTTKAAISDANILITGENGTGKEMLAREIHALSPRKQKPMICVDMGAISENLFESELFGHVKGAFTDARNNRIGQFQAADGGTLFMDEVGNLPLHLQSKLLRVLQQRSIIPVGSNTPIDIDMRLICATNRQLTNMVAEGTFREDLLYRINTIHLHIPSLRERPDDIIPLARLFVQYYGERYGKPDIQLATHVESILQSYPWTGNIRQLQHAMEKAVVICDNKMIDDIELPRQPIRSSTASTLEDMETQMIQQALEKHRSNLTAVAAELGISRQTLYNKMKKYGL